MDSSLRHPGPAFLRPVPADDIPDYPLGEVRLEAHYFTIFHHHRWAHSRLHLLASYEVQGIALNLFFLAQTEFPAGTLPNDDAMLASLLRMDVPRWQDMRSRSLSPLNGWAPCRCGDEIRLMHPWSIEIVQNALDQREKRERENSSKAVSMRLKRLREVLDRLGIDRALLNDEILLDRLDGWLLENCPGQRREPVVIRAIQHAQRQGWFDEIANFRK